MPYVQLNRRFSPWRDEDTQRDDFALFEREFYGDVQWDEILKRQRVIVLSEAGSGKSRELEEQAAKLITAGEFAFHTTVQKVASDGLDAALDNDGRERLARWRDSDAVGWFFIDSIDEAKLDHIRFADALSKLADGLGNNKARARVIISGRYSRWEFRADLKKLNELLPAAKVDEGAPLDPEQILASILRNTHKGREKVKPEKPLVVLMAPLDKKQVRQFAEGQGVHQLDEFMAALERENLWHFAKRPLDLGWLVDYWQRHARFGRLSEMLEASIRARLQEENPEHGARDEIDPDEGLKALERIAATLVFGRGDKIEIPDTEISLEPSGAFKLREILPDWATEKLPKLLSRPVFDPATVGQVRLHNDNEGVVRGYLAARWLNARLDGNAPKSRVRALLFGDADGVPVVLPSVRETAAWLAIWSDEVAQEIIARDPALLLTAGDPASLRLDVRLGALEATFAQYAAGIERYRFLDRDTLRRFATPDILPALRAAWTQHNSVEEVRRLILTMIEAGKLQGGIDIAREAVAATYSDKITPILAVRALGSVGTDDDLQALAQKVAAEFKTLDAGVVWEALDAVFPKHLNIDALVQILDGLEKAGDTAHHFDWRGTQLVDRLRTREQFKQFTKAVLPLVEEHDEEEEDEPKRRGPGDNKFKPLLQSAASGLLKLLPARSIDIDVVDAAVRLASDQYGGRRFDDEAFGAALQASPERRRIGLWRAVELLKDHKRVHNGLTNLWQLEFAGWPAGLREEDIPWLLEDARDGDTPIKRQLALTGLLPLWRDHGKSDELLEKIKDAAEKSQVSKDFLKAWLEPPKREPWEIEHHEKMAKLKKQHDLEDAKRDKSWRDFLDGLKANPTQLRTPPADLKPGHTDGRIFYIWELLYSASEERTGYSIDGLGILAEVLGPELSEEVTSALIRFWRSHKPTLTSSRKPDARNQTNKLDSMSISAISMEAKRDPNWLNGLSSSEATTAAQLSTQELNGFPRWLFPLAEVWPDEVRDVFVGEIADHLAVAPDQHGFLDTVGYSEPALAKLVAPFLLRYVEEHPDLAELPLSKVFRIIRKAIPNVAIPRSFIDLALERFKSFETFGEAATYLGFVMLVAPAEGVVALSEKLDTLSADKQKALAENVLPAVFGDGWLSGGISPKVLPFDVLERLVVIAFRTIRHEEDVHHDGVYSPGLRDHAEGARSNLFKQLCATPGRETLEALRRLSAEPGEVIPLLRIDRLIYDRACEDAEHAKWPAAEARELEKQFDIAPRTPRDLQLLALSRLEDISHDLHHHRFGQGQSFKRHPNEREVQKALAWELEHEAGRAYTMEREPHVADEKEPDIRLQARATTASLPLEIKVTESWTIQQLEDAITVQLAGRYLRERDARHGVLVLVHQHARAQGWEAEDGTFLKFSEVVERLKALAYRLGVGGTDAARVEIAVVDISDIEEAVKAKPKRRSAAGRKSPAK